MVQKILTDEQKAFRKEKKIAHRQLMEEHKRLKEQRRIAHQQLLVEQQRIKAERLRIKQEVQEQLKNKKEEERKKKLEERLKRREQRRKEAQESFMRDEEKFFSELKPPFNGLKGKWVRHSDNMGVLKSFGIFICNTCNKLWFSAHAISIYKQACKECTEVYVYPKYMWINENNNVENNDLSTTRKRSKNPHHRTELCEACQNGECTFS